MSDFVYINSKGNNSFLDFVFDLDIGIRPISFDTETTGLDVFTCELLLVQVKVEDHIYIFDAQALGKSFMDEVIRMIIDSKRLLIMHNAKFDIKVIKNQFNRLITNVHDTLWCETLINAGIGEVLYSLSTLVKKYIGIELGKETRKDFYENFTGITQEMLIYSALDVAYLEEIREKQLDLIKLAREERVLDLENRLVPVVAMMEFTGIKLDKEKWTKMAEANYILYEQAKEDLQTLLVDSVDYTQYKSALDAVDKLKIPVKTKRDRQPLETVTGAYSIRGIVKALINFGSHTQMLTLLNTLGVPLVNTNEKTMKELKGKYDVIDKILEFRELEKKESSYGINFLNHIHSKDGRIHTEYFNMGTQTGRFSCNRPNLQQVPREAVYRDCFISEEGKSLISIDYSQQEYRLVGAISGEPVIIQAYKDGIDMHYATAVMHFKKPLSEITADERHCAKNKINFPIVYGSSAYGLSRTADISVEKGEETLDNFRKGYPVLTKFREAIEGLILKNRYSVTLLGRKRYFPDEPSFADPKELNSLRGRTKREGFNHIIQGTAADITKLAMIEIFETNPFGNKLNILLQVHDELVIEADDDIIKEAERFAKEVMESVEQRFLGEIPAKVDGEVGKCWIH